MHHLLTFTAGLVAGLLAAGAKSRPTPECWCPACAGRRFFPSVDPDHVVAKAARHVETKLKDLT